MFSLPPISHKASEAMGDLATVAEILNPSNLARMSTFDHALRSARANFPAGAKAVNVICLRADDERWLISVGPRGGWRKLWNFGTGRGDSAHKLGAHGIRAERAREAQAERDATRYVDAGSPAFGQSCRFDQ